MTSTTQSVCEIIESLGLDLQEYHNRYSGCCPIHGGDNRTAFCIYKETGVWNCFTNNCHQTYGSSLYSLLKLLGKEAKINMKSNITGINNIYLENENKESKPIPRERVRQTLHFPAGYFISRGFTESVLDKYDVGLCKNPDKRMYNRCVVPIYEHTRRFMIGCTGRAIDETEPKWLHSRFSRNSILYNSWFAASYIHSKNTAIIVEGPGDIWKLEDAGIHCGLAILGSSLTPNQLKLLSQLGTMNVVLLLDNDDAGKNATSKIVKQLKNLYNIEIPEIGSFNDVGDMPTEEIQRILTPVLKKYD